MQLLLKLLCNFFCATKSTMTRSFARSSIFQTFANLLEADIFYNWFAKHSANPDEMKAPCAVTVVQCVRIVNAL